MSLIIVIGILVFAGVANCQDQCFTRRSWLQLTTDERIAYTSAVKLLAVRSGNSATTWDDLASVHNRVATQIHGTPLFLYWHRAFLHFMEHLLGMAIPYYDSASDCTNRIRSCSLWAITSNETESFLGGNGDSSGCVNSGAFSSRVFDIMPGTRRPRCLQRRFGNGNLMSISDVMRSISSCQTASCFRRTAEASFHAHFHIQIGGEMGAMYSPCDPLFLLHHAWVDMIWASWQSERIESRVDVDSNAFETVASANTAMPGLVQMWQTYLPNIPQNVRTVTPREVLRIGAGQRICSTYVSNNQKRSNLESQRKIIRDFDEDTDDEISEFVRGLDHPRNKPDPLPTDYIQMNNLNETSVRAFERKYFGWIDKVNNHYWRKHSRDKFLYTPEQRISAQKFIMCCKRQY